MNAEQMWAAYAAGHPEAAGADYDAWAFGGDPDGLARLVLSGVQTATTSAYPLYALEGEPLLERAAAWFHEKWGYPLEAYRESMEECLAGGGPVPQWYMAVAEGRIIRRFMSGMDGSFSAWCTETASPV